MLETHSPRMAAFEDISSEDIALSCRIFTREGCRRIVCRAFEYAKAHGYPTVTVVEKPNVIRETSGLMVREARKIAAEYPEIELWETNVDAMVMWMVKNPQDYGVMVASNMFGDIVSDLAAQLVGGLGFASSGNIGDDFAVFEPTHGSAPKYAGQYRANPTAMLLAVKLMLDERDLPSFEQLRRAIEEAHREHRAVAVHCVTRAELVLAATALAAAGGRVGDRIEHAAVAPPDAIGLLAKIPLTVVTQPGFVHERGDAYLTDVDPGDRRWLYRCRGFLEASVPLGGGSDAPFGDPDPWRAMRAAVERRTEAGATLGPEEALTPERALALFTSPPTAPGAPPRHLTPGVPADLCLLDRPWSSARDDLSSARVAATLREGAILWQRG